MHEQKGQVLYVSHGGGPLPLLGDPGHRSMVTFMQDLPSKLHMPEAILVISAHWEERYPTVLGSENPPMLYDYYGFPEQAYALDYPAKGNPGLAGRIVKLLEKSGMVAHITEDRGFDHGLYVPLRLMYP